MAYSTTESYEALIGANQVICGLLLLTPHGCYKRDAGEWISLDPDGKGDDHFDHCEAVSTTEDFVDLFDSAEETDGKLVQTDL